MNTNPPNTRAEQIFKRFVEFHKANPVVWQLFERFALDLIRANYKNYSSDAIYHRIRWHLDVETKSAEVKLNDHYTAYYARMFHVAHPEHEGFFRNRNRTSAGRPAADVDVQVFAGGPPMNEHRLMEEIRGLLVIPS